jgi:hypothetical protein
MMLGFILGGVVGLTEASQVVCELACVINTALDALADDEFLGRLDFNNLFGIVVAMTVIRRMQNSLRIVRNTILKNHQPTARRNETRW